VLYALPISSSLTWLYICIFAVVCIAFLLVHGRSYLKVISVDAFSHMESFSLTAE
jgi:hypothetical protein